MGLDAKLKRFFPLLLCFSIAIAAYFQAAGIGQLVVSAVVGGTEPSAAPETMPAADAPARPAKDGKAILARNPFDSVTGPLDGSAAPAGEVPKPDAPVEEVTNEDPACSFGRVVLISATDDPQYAFA